MNPVSTFFPILEYNRTKDCEFVVVPIRQLVDEFNAFLVDCFDRVRKLGEDIQVRQYDETV